MRAASSELSIAICDANVLIDYFDVDEDLIRELVRCWKQVYVPDVVLHEVRRTNQKRAEELGLVILETPLELPESKRLSFADRACLYFVVQNHWICITNDARLGAECLNRGEQVVRGLEMLIKMTQIGHITTARALDCAERIHRINPAITAELLARFKQLLEPAPKVVQKKSQTSRRKGRHE